jgi:uncharacterized membrane protein
LALAICFIPGKILARRQKIYIRVVIPVIVIFAAIIWNYEISNIITAGDSVQHSNGAHNIISASSQLKHIISKPLNFVFIIVKSAHEMPWFAGVFGTLGYNFVTLPGVVISYLTVVLSWAAIYQGKVKKSIDQDFRKGSIFFGIALLAMISIITTLYLAYNPVGASVIQGVQGRYFLPVLPFLLYGLGRILPIKLHTTEKWATLLFSSSITLCLIISVVWYYKITYLQL